MKLSLILIDNEPVVWANKSKPASIAGKVSVMGVLPFCLLLFMPYSTVFWATLTNFLLDIYKHQVGALRWADVFRGYRTIFNGGYWHPHSTHFVRQTKRSWDHFKGIRH